jgi:hypothetical protein
MDQNNEKTGQSLGIASLVTGIIAFVMAVIPCIGTLAIVPAIIAVVLAAIGLGRMSGQGRGVVIAGLIIGIVALMISLSQWLFFGKVAGTKNLWQNDLKEAIEQVKTDVFDEIEKGDFSIRIQSGDEVVEIKSGVDIKKVEENIEKLEELEKTLPDTVKKK